MTLRRNLRVLRHRLRYRAGRAFRPRQLLATLTLIVAMAVAVGLLLLVVSENAVNTSGTTATPPPSTQPKTTTPKTTTPKTTTPKTTTPKASTPKTTTPTTKPVGQTVPLGVYAGPGSPVAATAFSADAGAPVTYAFDYLDGSSWQTIADPIWFVQRWSGSGFRMIWGVPMLPTTGATLAAGATGQYDAYFSQLAYTLVANGQADSVIMLGWDPEGSTLPWAVSTAAEAADYVAYWRQIVTTMRSVSGEQFQFAWDTAPGSAPTLIPALYPGNAYVDIVATDAFDVGATAVDSGWDALAEAPYGPDWFATFAAEHKKPFMIAKWGLAPTTQSGGGDNPTFVSQFLRWADREHLFAAVTWDYGSWAVTGGDFPKSAAMLHSVAEAGDFAPIAKAVDT
jgi:hypothetical protein